MHRSSQDTSGELVRALGLRDCVLLVVGAIIGSGIFLTPSTIAREVQTVEAVLFVWVVGGLLSFCGAVSFAELGAAYPEAGGIYVFLHRAYGGLVAFLYGWAVFFVTVPGAVATLGSAFGIYLNYLIPMPPWAVKVVSVTLILLLTLINCLGIRAGAFVQNLLTVVKIASLLGIGAVLFYVATPPGSSLNSFGSSLSFPPLGALGVAMIAVLWSYDGWHLLTFTAGEVKNPKRNLTWGLILGTGIVIGLYLIVNLAYLQVLSLSEIAGSSRVAGDALERAVGPIGGTLVAGAILISISGAMNGNVLAGPRVPFAMAVDRLFFRKVSYVHPEYQVPTVAIALTGILAAFLSIIGTYEELFTYVISVSWIFYGLGTAAVIVLRRKDPGASRPYKAWGYPVVPVLFSLVAGAIVMNSLLSSLTGSAWGFLVLSTGLPAYLYWKRKKTDS